MLNETFLGYFQTLCVVQERFLIHSDFTVSNVVVEDFLKPLETAEAEKGRKKKSNV